MSSITVNKINDLYVIKKNKDSRFFTTGDNTIIISTFNFYALLKFMLLRGLINVKTLEGLVTEYYTYIKGD